MVEKKKQKSKPAAEKPAAEQPEQIADEGPTPTFGLNPANPTLPAFPGDRDRRFGTLADIAFASGLFPGETPATLAIRIAAGVALGLGTTNALFDVEVTKGGAIRWKPGQPFQATADAIAAVNADAIDPDNADFGDTRSYNAAAGVIDDREDGPVIDITTGRKITRPAYDPDELTDAAAFAIAEMHDAARSIALAEIDQKEKNALDALAEIDRAETAAEVLAEIENANSGPPPIAQGEPDRQGLKGKQSDTGPQSGEMAAESGPICEPDPLTERIGSQETVLPTGGDGPLDAKHGPATPDPALPAGVGAGGNETFKVIKFWRKQIADWLKDLSHSQESINSRLAKFDNAATAEKRDMYEQADKYHRERTNNVKAQVLDALRADGKQTFEQMKGFFLFADVGTDPEKWSYSEAARALAITKEKPAP
jgi:hypothetical protein